MIKHRRETQPPVDVCEFQVIGERKDDPGHLLLMGRDGRWYDYDVALETIAPAEPGDSWTVDVIENAAVRVQLPCDKMAS